jgi:uncharacterized membrane protein YhaH (DUF805 family)
MKNFLVDLFTWKWRWNRLKFILYPITIVIPFFIVWGIFTVLIRMWLSFDSIPFKILYILSWLNYILLFYILITSYIKRLRDLNKNSWMTLLLLVPFANFYLWFICIFLPWTPWKNRFWDNPLGNKEIKIENNDSSIEL